MRKPITILFLLLFFTSCNNNYKSELKEAYKNSVQLSAASIALSEQVAKVWRDAIFDHEYSFGSKNEYISDFNEAIVKLSNEPEVQFITNQIDSMVGVVKKQVANLSDPPNKYKEVYEEVVSISSMALEASQMATSPSGSLQTYSQNINRITSDVNSKMNTIELKNPDIFNLDSKN